MSSIHFPGFMGNSASAGRAPRDLVHGTTSTYRKTNTFYKPPFDFAALIQHHIGSMNRFWSVYDDVKMYAVASWWYDGHPPSKNLPYQINVYHHFKYNGTGDPDYATSLAWFGNEAPDTQIRYMGWGFHEMVRQNFAAVVATRNSINSELATIGRMTTAELVELKTNQYPLIVSDLDYVIRRVDQNQKKYRDIWDKLNSAKLV